MTIVIPLPPDDRIPTKTLLSLYLEGRAILLTDPWPDSLPWMADRLKDYRDLTDVSRELSEEHWSRTEASLRSAFAGMDGIELSVTIRDAEMGEEGLTGDDQIIESEEKPAPKILGKPFIEYKPGFDAKRFQRRLGGPFERIQAVTAIHAVKLKSDFSNMGNARLAILEFIENGDLATMHSYKEPPAFANDDAKTRAAQVKEFFEHSIGDAGYILGRSKNPNALALFLQNRAGYAGTCRREIGRFSPPEGTPPPEMETMFRLAREHVQQERPEPGRALDGFDIRLLRSGRAPQAVAA